MWASGGGSGGSNATGFDSKLSVKLTANQLIAGTTWTIVDWDTADYDGLSELDAANSKIVIDADGYYSLKYCLVWQNQAAGKSTWSKLKVNGTVVIPGNKKPADTTGEKVREMGSIDMQLSAGDEITLEVYHDEAGGFWLHYATDGGTVLTVHRFA